MTFGILALGFPVSEVLQLLQPLGGSRRFCRFRRFCIPIFMHSLGDVWHPGSGVPCFAAFAAFGGSQSHFLPYIFPIFMHSLGDVWHPGSGVPCFGGFAAFAAFGGSQSHFLPYIFPIFMHSLGDVWHPYLNAYLRWRLASWLWGSLFRRFCSLWGLTVSLSSLYLPYLHAFLRWCLASLS